MKMVNIHEAKTHLSRLINEVIEGHEILIAQAGKPVAKIIPLQKTQKRIFGVLKNKVKIAKDFDDSLSDDIMKDFE